MHDCLFVETTQHMSARIFVRFCLPLNLLATPLQMFFLRTLFPSHKTSHETGHTVLANRDPM
jgi:hypothetical protein